MMGKTLNICSMSKIHVRQAKSGLLGPTKYSDIHQLRIGQTSVLERMPRLLHELLANSRNEKSKLISCQRGNRAGVRHEVSQGGGSGEGGEAARA